MSGPDDALWTLYDRALDLNQEMFTRGHHMAAYHALVVALHLAFDLTDDARLEQVELIAREQSGHMGIAEGEPRESPATALYAIQRHMWMQLPHEVRMRRQVLSQRRLIHAMRPSDTPPAICIATSHLDADDTDM